MDKRFDLEKAEAEITECTNLLDAIANKYNVPVAMTALAYCMVGQLFKSSSNVPHIYSGIAAFQKTVEQIIDDAVDDQYSNNGGKNEE